MFSPKLLELYVLSGQPRMQLSAEYCESKLFDLRILFELNVHNNNEFCCGNLVFTDMMLVHFKLHFIFCYIKRYFRLVNLFQRQL